MTLRKCQSMRRHSDHSQTLGSGESPSMPTHSLDDFASLAAHVITYTVSLPILQIHFYGKFDHRERKYLHALDNNNHFTTQYIHNQVFVLGGSYLLVRA